MLTLAQIHGQPEIFHSIQGEGVSQGTPCVFLASGRLQSGLFLV